MATFESSKVYPAAVPDLAPVAQEVMEHFKQRGYDVSGEQTIMCGWHISISKGGVFKAVLGMKTAMNIEITPLGGGTSARAGIGIFGMQVIPTAISYFLFWPVLIPQDLEHDPTVQAGRRSPASDRAQPAGPNGCH